MLVEACIDSVESALAAERGGALRLELCDNLSDGGTTPSMGMIMTVLMRRENIPVFVIVRPRGGSFVYSNDELAVMRIDIGFAQGAGADGIVSGALRADGTIDVDRTRELIELARPLPFTFHRAFDLTPDLDAALDTLIELGCDRVLTSGGAPSALAGAERIGSLVTRSAGRIVIMAGGGVREENVADVVRRSGVREIHVRGTRLVNPPASSSSEIRSRKSLPADEGAFEETDESRIRALVALAKEHEPHHAHRGSS